MKRRIGIISPSVIPDDPCVPKQDDLLANTGWDVIAIGLPGHRSCPPGWRCLAVDEKLAVAADANYRLRLFLKACDRAIAEVDGARHVSRNEAVGSNSQLGD